MTAEATRRSVLKYGVSMAGAGAVAALLPPALSRTPASAASATAEGSLAHPGLIASDFLRPSTQAKSMVRTWFPDAGAGESADGLALVVKQFTDQAAAGFGGAEIAFLGVSSMSQVAGTGSYSRQFSLPSGWTPDNGAYLQLTHGQDMVVAVTVNGHALPTIDQFSDQLDLGGYLTPGPNTIAVRIDTTLNNRITAKTARLYGLTGVQLTPYQQTVLG
jgi:hypothetical protein